MASLGKLTVYVDANIKGFTSQMGKLRTEVQKMNKTITKEATKGAGKSKNLFGDPRAAAAYAEKVRASLQKILGPLYQVKNTVREVDGQFKVGGASITKSAQRMGTGIASGAKTGMAGLLSLRSFMAKIVHYITFSIGVQLVMGIRQAFSSLIETFSEYERAITNAVTVSGYLGSAFEEVKDRVSDLAETLSKKTVYSSLEVAKAFYSIASAGYDISKITEQEVIPILNYAAATQAELDTATQAVLTTIKAFNLTLEDTARVTDVFVSAITSSFLTMDKLREAMKYVAPIAGTLGVSVEETVGAVAALANVGMEGGQAGQRLNMVLTKLLKPTDRARTMFESMGLTMQDLDPNIHSIVDILYKLQAANFGAAEAATMFRARTAGAAVVLVENADSIARMITQYKLALGVTEAVAQAQEETLWGTLKKTADEMQRIAINIGEQLAPSIENILTSLLSTFEPLLLGLGSTLNSIFTTLTGTFNQLKPLIQGMVNGVVTLVNSFLSLYNIIKPILPVIIMYFVIMKSLKLILWAVAKATVFYYKVLLPLAKFIRMLVTYKKTYVGVSLMLHKAVLAESVANVQAAGSQAVLTGSTVALTGAIKSLTAALLTNPLTWFAVAIGAVVAAFAVFGRGQQKISRYVRSSSEEMAIQMGIMEDTDSVLLKSTKNMRKFWGAMSELYFENKEDPWSAINIGKFAEDMKITEKDLREVYKRLMDDTEEYIGINKKELREALETWGNIESIEGVGAIMKNISKETVEYVNNLIASATKNKEKLRAVVDLSDEYIGYQVAIENAIQADKDEKVALDALNDAYLNNADSLDILIEKTEEYEAAKAKSTKTDELLLTAVKDLLTGIRSYSEDLSGDEPGGNLDEWVGILEDASAKTFELSEKQARQTIIMRDQKNAAVELSRAILQYGSSSDEAASAQERLNTLIEASASLTTEIAEIQSVINTNTSLYNAVLKDRVDDTQLLTDTEKLLLQDANNIINIRDKSIKAEIKYNKALAQQNVLDNIRESHSTILEEKMRIYLEAQQKIFDIEEKLYKLRVNEDEQMEGLFDKLAEQGQLTEEMIKMYSDIEEAQGAILEIEYDHTRAFDALTESQQEVVKAYYRGEVGLDALRAAGIDNIDIFEIYKQRQQDLKDATDAFREAIIPLVSDLKDIGAITAETAQAYYDIIDNALEVAQANFDMLESQNAIVDSWNGMIDTNSMLALSLMDNADSASSVIDVYDEFLNKLGVTRQEASSTMGSLGALSDEELIVGATLIQAAKSIGVYEEGMSIAELKNKLMIKSLEDLNNIATVSLSSMEPYYEIADAVGELKTAFDLAKDALLDLTAQLQVFLGLTSEDMFEFSVGFNFKEVLERGFKGNLEALLDFAKGKGYEFSFDIASQWEGEDWKSFIDAIDDNYMPALEGILEDVSPEIDINTEWDGNEWKSWYSNLSSTKKNQINRAFDNFIYKFEVGTLWDGTDYVSWYNSLSSDKQTAIKTIIGNMGGDIKNITKWDNEDWDNFLNTLLPQHELAIQELMDAWDLTFNIQPNFEEPKKPEEPFKDVVVLPDTPTGSIGLSKGQTVISPDKVKIIPDTPTGSIGLAPGDIVVDRGTVEKANAGNITLPPGIRNIIEKSPLGHLLKLQSGGIITKQQLALIGEKGPEAIIPLTGSNKKEGEKILASIIPEFFPIVHEKLPTLPPGSNIDPRDWYGNSLPPKPYSGFNKDDYEFNKLDLWIQAEENLGKLNDSLKKRGVSEETIARLAPIAADKFKGKIGDSSKELEFAIDWVIQNEKKSALEKINIEKTAAESVSISLSDSTNMLTSSFNDVLSDFSETSLTASQNWIQSVLKSSGDWLSYINTTSQNWYESVGNSAISLYNYIISSSDQFNTLLTSTGGVFSSQVLSASVVLLSHATIASGLIVAAATELMRKINAASININVQHSHVFSYYYYTFGWAKGGIVPGLQKGDIVKGSQIIEVGEKGAEAIVPLTGTNKKFGEKILQTIIPKYYPDLFLQAQTGGLFGGATGGSVTYGGDTNYVDEYNIMGPITVTGVQDVKGFMDNLKMRARATGARK